MRTRFPPEYPGHEFTGERREFWLIEPDWETVTKITAERVVVTMTPHRWVFPDTAAPDAPKTPTHEVLWFVGDGPEHGGQFFDLEHDTIHASELAAYKHIADTCAKEMEAAAKWTLKHFKSSQRVRELLDPQG